MGNLGGKPYIVCWGGHKLFFLEPKPNDYSIVRVAHALAQERRFAGNYGNGYSVAQHSVLVSLGVELLGGSSRQSLAGLVHDASEMLTGDLPSPLKAHLSGFNHIEALQNKAIEEKYGVNLEDPLVKEVDKMVLSAEVRMLVPQREQRLFDVDPKYHLNEQPGWTQVLPWTYNEAVGQFLDRYEFLAGELKGEKYERN